MLVARRSQCLAICSRRARSSACQAPSRRKSTLADPQTCDATSAIPETPTWSVHELISSYPRPTISPATLKKLHELSALVPPAEGTEEHARTQRELEEMIRLVEAVKLVDTQRASKENLGGGIEGIPDGRIWPEGEGMALSSNTRVVEFEDADVESGRQLQKYASWTKEGFYIVEADRRRK